MADKEFTKADLAKYDGKDDSLPIYLACDGVVFDVTAGKDFYGPQGAYSKLAGKDATRALAKMSLDEEHVNSSQVDDLSEEERNTAIEWKTKFNNKYAVVGKLVL